MADEQPTDTPHDQFDAETEADIVATLMRALPSGKLGLPLKMNWYAVAGRRSVAFSFTHMPNIDPLEISDILMRNHIAYEVDIRQEALGSRSIEVPLYGVNRKKLEELSFHGP